jgi:hypothetical protein
VARKLALAALAYRYHTQAGWPGSPSQYHGERPLDCVGADEDGNVKGIESYRRFEQRGRVFDIAYFQHGKAHRNRAGLAQGRGEMCCLPGRARHHDMAAG